jgi:hypothetical protein
MKGFSTLLLLFSMPVVLGLLAISLSSFLLIYNFTEIQSLCRDTALKAQVQLAKGLNEILSLNPKAQYLRHKEKALMLARAAAAGNAVLIAKLTHQLYLNRLEQKKLRLQMQTLKWQAESHAEFLLFKNYKLKPATKPQLHLVHKPSTALAPDFVPSPRFEVLQKIKLSWTTHTENFFSKILQMPLVNSSCGSTLYKKEGKWVPVLSADKY